MKERFLVEHYTGIDPQTVEERDPKIKIVYQDELWNILQKAIEKPPKIAVHKIGECVIDWS